MTLKWI